MPLREEILKEHSKKHALHIASLACASKKDFKELVSCFLSNDYRLAQIASWCLHWAVKQKPGMIAPYIKKVVAQLQRKDVHPSVIRHAVNILQSIDIPEEFHGEVMNACFSFIETPSTAIAIKAFSLTTLYNLSKTYPEIRSELKLIIEERWDTETAAFRGRGKKILADLKKPL
jgi:hypothetical protein